MNFLSNVSESVEPPQQEEKKENDSAAVSTSIQQFFIAVLLLAAANAWNTVFTEAFDYYRPKLGGASVLMGSVFFSVLLTVIAISYARFYYKDEMAHHSSS